MRYIVKSSLFGDRTMNVFLICDAMASEFKLFYFGFMCIQNSVSEIIFEYSGKYN